jgi:hypothetical protein
MCKIKEYPFPNNPKENINLFPEELIKGKVLFHGTSRLYSEIIDKDGFTEDSFTISRSQIEHFLEILYQLNMPDCDIESLTPKLRIKAYLDDDNTSISLAFNAYEALFYAIGRTKGGQILMAFEDAIERIKINEFDLNIEQSEIVNSIYDKIVEIKQSEGCIYLIDFNDHLLEKHISKSIAYNGILTNGFDMAILNGEKIPCNIIKAKMYVPVDFDIDENLLKKISNISGNEKGNDKTYQFDLNQRELKSKLS